MSKFVRRAVPRDRQIPREYAKFKRNYWYSRLEIFVTESL